SGVFLADSESAGAKPDAYPAGEQRRIERPVSPRGRRGPRVAGRGSLPDHRPGSTVSAARRIGVVLVAALLGGSTAASADEWSITPFVGMTARTETGFIDLDGAARTRKAAIGVAAAWHLTRWVGVEGDLAVLPGFFESQTGLVE